MAAAQKAARRVLLIGGTSEIGLAIAAGLRSRGADSIWLLGRDAERMAIAAEALELSGYRSSGFAVLHAEDLASHREVIEQSFAETGSFDVVVLAVGVLGAQAGLDADDEQAAEVMQVNFVGCGSLMLHCLRRLRAQGSGTLVVLSSVGAERPRASNAVYGAAKAGLDALAQGLADATAQSGVRVLVVRPGFVTTRMTDGLPAAPMATTPQAVAEATVHALGGSAHTVWVPRRLRYVFAVLRHLPRPLYRRLPF